MPPSARCSSRPDESRIGEASRDPLDSVSGRLGRPAERFPVSAYTIEIVVLEAYVEDPIVVGARAGAEDFILGAFTIHFQEIERVQAMGSADVLQRRARDYLMTRSI